MPVASQAGGLWMGGPQDDRHHHRDEAPPPQNDRRGGDDRYNNAPPPRYAPQPHYIPPPAAMYDRRPGGGGGGYNGGGGGMNRAIAIATGQGRNRLLNAWPQGGSLYLVRVETPRGRVDMIVDVDTGRIVGER